MVIDRFTEEQKKAWDDFVFHHEEATFFHLMGWKEIIERVYGLQPFYLMAKTGERIEGVLPLFLMKHWLFGKKLISMPYAVSGGVCADTKQAEMMLIDEAVALSKQLNVDYLELRHVRERPGDLITRKTYFTFLIELNPEPEKVWNNIRKDSRRCIRRGLEQDMEIDMSCKDVKDFYRVYARGQRDLGTPVSSYRWIKQVFDAFPDNHRIARVRYQGKTIASLIIREFKKTVFPTIGYALKEYRQMYPFYVLFWKLIEEGCLKGFKWFDYGRSIPQSGTYQFKVHYGAQPVQLNYQYYYNNSKKLPDTSQSNPSRKRFARVWKRLPLSITNTLGPMIRKYYP